MNQQIYQRIRENPDFAQLVQARSRLSWTLVGVVLALFYGFILVVAFNPALTGLVLSDSGKLTLGVVVIFTMFILFWVLTAWYVRRANTEFDELTRRVVLAATKGGR